MINRRKKSDIKCLVILISLCLFCGCNPKEKGGQEESCSKINFLDPITVDVTDIKETDTPLRLSQFAESVSYIRLEDEPLLGDALKASLRILEDTIYVNSNNIYKYTPEGKFIKKIFKEGQGPGEAKKYYFSPAAFNTEKREITFSNVAVNNVTYSFDGDFIKKEKRYFSADQNTKSIETYHKGYSVFCLDRAFPPPAGTEVNFLGPNLFYVSDVNDSIVYSYPNASFNEKTESIGNAGVTVPRPMSFINIDSILWFKYTYVDTLYSASDFTKIYPRYIFKTDGTFCNLQEHARASIGHFDKSKPTKKISGVLPLPTKSLLFLIDRKIAFADTAGIASVYTKEKVLNDIDEYFKEIDLAMYIGSRIFCISDNHLYILVNAFEFFKEGCIPPFKDMEEESNPIIIKLKLKTE